MTTSGSKVLVIGAGAIGLSVAAHLQTIGHQTVLVDPAEGAQASAVAAGMIAPVMEVLNDALSASHGALLGAGAALWPAFAQRFGVELRTGGALWISPKAAEAPTEVAGRPLERISFAQASRLAPWLRDTGTPIAFAPEEACVASHQALAALDRVFRSAGGTVVRGAVRLQAGRLSLDGHPIYAEHIVLAAGYDSIALSALAPELAALSPIRGQIARISGLDLSADGPCVRGPGAYVAPQPGGVAMVGATMEAGEAAPAADPDVVGRLVLAASQFAPGLAGKTCEAMAAIRAGTPDGLPLVGRSSHPGLLLATGLRRNGWLLAPLVAAAIADCLTGNDPVPYARALDPLRF